MIYDTENQHIILVDSLPSGTYEPASWDDYEEGTFAWAITQANAYDGELEVVVQIDSSLSGQSLNDWSSMEFCSVTRSMSIVCEGYNMPYWYGSLYVEGYGVNLKVNGFYLNSVGTSSWASAGDTIELEHVYLSEGIYLQGDDLRLIINNSQASMLNLYGHNLIVEGSGNYLWGNGGWVIDAGGSDTTYDISHFFFEADETSSWAQLYLNFTEDTTLYSSMLEEYRPSNIPCQVAYNIDLKDSVTLTLAANQEININNLFIDNGGELICEEGSILHGYLYLSGGKVVANDMIIDANTHFDSGIVEINNVTFTNRFSSFGAHIVGDNIRVEWPIVNLYISSWDGDESSLSDIYSLTNTSALPGSVQDVRFSISKQDVTITQNLLENITPAFCERSYISYVNVDKQKTVNLNNIIWNDDDEYQVYLEDGVAFMNDCTLSGKLKITDWRQQEPGKATMQNCIFNHAEVSISLHGDFTMHGCKGVGTINLAIRNGGHGTFSLSGNDFSQMQLQLTIPDGQSIDLSGNYWGTNNKADIMARLGADAGNIILDSILQEDGTLLWLNEDSAEIIRVTNTNDTGEGSLREAIARANAAADTEARVTIILNDQLGGQTIELGSDLSLTYATSIIAPTAGVSLTGGNINTSAELKLQNITLPRLELNDAAAYRGEDVVLTSATPLLLTRYSGEADFSGTRAAAETEAVLISGTLTSAASPAYGLSSGILRLSADTEIPAEECFELPPGMQIDLEGRTLNIFGTLHAANEEGIDVLANEGTGNVYVKNGGRLELENSYFHIASNGKLSGRLQVDAGGILVSSGGNIRSTDFYMYGTIELTDTYVRCSNTTLYSGGSLTAERARFSLALVLNNGSTAAVNNTHFYTNLTANGTATLTDNTIDGYLQTSNTNRLSGSGNVINGELAYRFTDFSGSTANVLNITRTTAENAYAEVQGYLYNCSFISNTEKLSGGYVQSAKVTIAAGYTTNICDGAVWRTNGVTYDLDTNGTLNITDATLILAGSSSNDRSNIRAYNGSTVNITRSTVQGSGTGSVLSNDNNIHIASGATVNITDSVLTQLDGIQTLSGGTLNLTRSEVTSPRITIESGATATLIGNTITGELSISLAADIQALSGNDFAHTSITLRDMAPGRTIDLSGNTWGTEDRAAIAEKLGIYAPYVVIDGKRMATEEVLELHVTNTDNDGVNSLRWALAQVNAYNGAEVVRITIDDALAGKTIALNSDLSLSKAAVLIGPANGLTITGGKINTTAPLSLSRLTLPQIALSGAASLTAEEGVVFTSAAAVTIGSTWSGTIDLHGATATANDAYVSLSGTLNGNSTFRKLPASFEGGYRFGSSVTIAAGKTVTMDKGVQWYQKGNDLSINGTLRAWNDTAVNVLLNDGYYGYIYINNGGLLELTKSNILFVNTSNNLCSRVEVKKGGTLRMQESDLRASSFAIYGTAELNDTYVRCGSTTVYSGGNLSATGNEIYYYVQGNAGSSITLKDCRLSSYVSASGTLVMEDCTCSSYVNAYGTATFKGVTMATLGVNTNTRLTIGEGGITLTGENAFKLYDWAGDTDTFFNSFAWTATAENWYVTLGGTMGDATFHNTIKEHAADYRFSSSVTIAAGKTVTMDKGTQWDLEGNYLYINGTLKAENDTATRVLTNEGYGYIYVNRGGTLDLTKSNIRIAEGTSLRGRLQVESGGALRMQNANLQLSEFRVYGTATFDNTYVRCGSTTVYSGGNLSATGNEIYYDVQGNTGSSIALKGCTLSSYVSASGTLVMEDCTCSSYVNAYGTATFKGATMATLGVNANTRLTIGEGGITLTGENAFKLYDWAGDTDTFFNSFAWTATAENWYVTLGGTMGDATFHASIRDIAADYRLTENVTVAAGKTVSLDKGSQWTLSGSYRYLYINGTLKAENDDLTSVLCTTSSNNYIYVNNGGTLNLTRSGIRFINTSDALVGRLQVESGGTLRMQESDLRASSFYTYGQAELTDTYVGCSSTTVYNGGRLEARDTEFYYYLTANSGSTLVLENCTINNYLAAYGTTQLNRVSMTELAVNAGTQLQVGADGITLTGQKAFTLRDWAGDTDTFFNSFAWTATAENWYVTLGGTMGDATFHASIRDIAADYLLTENVTVAAGKTVSLDKGSQWTLSGSYRYLYINGTLKAENDDLTSVLCTTSSNNYIYVNNGGTLNLTRSGIRFINTSDALVGRLQVESGGTLRMQESDLRVSNFYIYGQAELTDTYVRCSSTTVYSGGRLEARDTEFYNYLTANKGSSLVLDGTTFDNNFTVSSGATADVANCTFKGKVSLSMGANYTHLSGNDFSAATISLTDTAGGGAIDLSGNYWGTTDIDAIKAKIANYDENKVLLNSILSVNPSTVFTYTGNSLRYNQIGSGEQQVTLYFSHEIDKNSLRADSIRLVDAQGHIYLPSSYEVVGKNVIANFAPFDKEGLYNLVFDDALRDLAGNSLQATTQYLYDDRIRVRLTPPKVAQIAPSGDFTGVLDGVTLTFTDVMDTESLRTSVHLLGPNGKEIAVQNIISLGGNAYHFQTAEQTAYGSYQVTVSSGAASCAGNPLDQNGNGVPGEDDDAFRATFSIAEVDLTITDMELSSNGYVGDTLVVHWTGENATGFELRGEWTDGVYLSTDDVWDVNDKLMGTITHTGGLAVGETYQAELQTSVPLASSGHYYVLVRSDIKGQETGGKEVAAWTQNLRAQELTVQLHDISDGEETSGFLSPADRKDYYILPHSSGFAQQLNINNTGNSVFYVYARYGATATSEQYDEVFTVHAGENTLLLPGDGNHQDIYLTVYSKANSGISYTMSAQRAGMVLKQVTGRSLNTATESVFDLTGVNLPYDAQVQFIHKESGQLYTPDKIEWLNSSHIKATFQANSLVSGQYGVLITQGSEKTRLSEAITMYDGADTDSGYVIAYNLPSVLGYHVLSKSTISCCYLGHETVDAPLISFTISQNRQHRAFLTLDKSIIQNGFWTSSQPAGFFNSVSFLATPNKDGYLNPIDDKSFYNFTRLVNDNDTIFFHGGPGVKYSWSLDGNVLMGDSMICPLYDLFRTREGIAIGLDDHKFYVTSYERQPANTVTTTIYYAGWQQPWDFSYPQFDYLIGCITAENTTPIDWEAICADTDSAHPELNVLIAQTLSGNIGETWGDYVKLLNASLRQLSDNGVNTQDVSADDLVDFAIRHAAGELTPWQTLSSATDMAVQTPGLSLAVSRTYASALFAHSQESSFGYGWTHNWDISLSKNSDGNTVMQLAGQNLIFRPSYLGGYTCDAGNDFALTTERNGSDTVSIGNGQLVYRFNAEGKLTSVSDVHGNSIFCTYSASGKLSKLTHSNGEWIAYRYNEQGYICELSSSEGRVNTFGYDNGHLVSAEDFLHDTVQYSYSESLEHFLTSVTTPAGTTTHFDYNEGGTLSGISMSVDQDSRVTRGSTVVTYRDDLGISVTNAYGYTSTFYYNLNGKVVKAIDVNGNAISYGYSDEGNLLWQRDQTGNITSYSYDAAGNLVSKTNALGYTTHYRYNRDGFLTGITDANGNALDYERNSKGDVTAIRYADGSEEHFTYDSVGNISSATARNGSMTSYTYDRLGRLLSVVTEAGTNTFSYDDFGNMLSSSDATETTTFSYNERLLLTSVSQSDGHTVSYTYDEKDRLSTMCDAAGHTTCYSYNAWGDLTRVEESDGTLIIAYEYDSEGRLLRDTRGNGTSAVYEYTREGFAQAVTYYAADGSVSDFYRYTYDAVGARTGMECADGIWTYRYDAIGQLIAADFVPSAASTVAAQQLEYAYDAVGNRTLTRCNGQETHYTHNALNQTTSAGEASYEYDANGYLISKTDAEGLTTYSWDGSGRLIRLTTATGDVYEYTYNAFGERVSSSHNGEVTSYVYDGSGGGNVLTVFAPNGAQVSQMYGHGLIGCEDAFNGTLWHEHDVLGSVTGITDSSGNLVATYSYEPFGNTISETAGISTPYGWLGTWGISEEAAGLALMRARYYDKTTGTFISPDPLGVSGGLNLYAYCFNSVTDTIDINGRAPDYNVNWGTEILLNIGAAGLGWGGDKLGKIVKEPGFAIVPLMIASYPVTMGYDVVTAGSLEERAASFLNDLVLLGIDGASAVLNKTNFGRIANFVHDSIIAGVSYYKNGVIDYRDLSTYGRLAGALTDFIVTMYKDSTRDREKEWKNLQDAINRARAGQLTQTSIPVQSAGSSDPNDLIGIAGYGEQNFITGKEDMPFMLEFENEEDATAPARWIRVFTTLDEAYDLESFTLDSVYLAGHLFSMKDGQDSFHQLTTLSFNGQEVLTQIEVNLNRDTRELSAVFTAIDPETGMMLQDLKKGLLYPNNDLGVGEGYITYTLKLKEGLTTGTTINNVADIYFDFNDVIPTPEITYTIDADTAHATLLTAEVQVDNSIMLTWEGADAEGGSGFAGVGIYVSKDGGELTFWQAVSAQSNSINYIAEAGHRYGFAVVGIDHAGNIEPVKQEAEIFVNLTNGDVVDSSKTIPLTAADALAGGTVTNSESVIDSVGYGDLADYYTFAAAADGTYAVALDMLAWEGISLSVGTTDENEVYHPQKERLLFMGAAHNAIEGITLRKGETAYIRVGAMEGAVSTDYYELRVVGEVPAAASITDNNTAETADTLVGSTAPAAVQGWVGYGDACDFYRLQLAETSNLQLTLSGVDTAARVKVYAEQTDGSRALISAGTATAATGLDRTLALTAGSYFIEVSSLNPDNGLSNSAYTMEIKEQKGKQNTHYMLAMR